MNEYDRNYFIFAGASSADFGVYVNGNKTFNSPERVIETAVIPGRHGDLLMNTGRFSNIDHTYEAFAFENFRVNLSKLQNHLLSKTGYQRLEDSYHPDEFYLAIYKASMDVEAFADLHAGTFPITFNRKPQRYLKSGEQKVSYSSYTNMTYNSSIGKYSGSIFNPTDQVAKPLIRVRGTGELGIGSETITIISNPGYIDLDCDAEDAYYDEAVNCNDKIKLNSGDFPILRPGKTGITKASSISSIEIIPRWWRI